MYEDCKRTDECKESKPCKYVSFLCSEQKLEMQIISNINGLDIGTHKM